MAKKTGPVCPECGSMYFTEDKSRGEKICAKCGLILEEAMVDVSQEWRAFDDEQRSRRARTGAPLTFSVEYNEPIVIKDNEVKVVKIGEFVDKIMEENKSKIRRHGILEFVAVPRKIFALSFDKDYNISFKPITEVSRHPVKILYELDMEYGKKVRVTGNHSIFTVINNKITKVRVDKLAKGAFVVAPKRMPSGNAKLSIDILEKITNPDLTVKLEELIPAPLKYKREWNSRNRIRIERKLAIRIAKKYNDKKLLKLARAPFIYLRIKNIKKINSVHKYAYDLTVPGCWNFIGKIAYFDTKHDKGMTTEIGKGPGELFKVASGKRAQYYRLSKWQKRLVESKDRNLSFALSELQRLISFLGLPRGVHEEVAKKYEQAVDWGLVRGRSMESVIAALLYAVCRELGTPRTLEEIAEASGVEKREIGRTYRYIARELAIRILPASPEHFVPRFASMLGLSDQVQAKAIQILKKAKKDHVTSGKGPTGVAAAALYIAAVLHGEKKTQREIADVVGVTEVTIRNRFKELVDDLGIAEEIEKRVKEVEK